MRGLSLLLGIGLLVLPPIGAEDEQCSADGSGCTALPEYPDCVFTCDEVDFIGPDSGNTRRVWPECPGGDGGCADCEDRAEDCEDFAAAYDGMGCEDNPSFMIDVCAKSCNTCHLRDLDVRCREVWNAPPALQPGDMNATFQRILRTPGLNAKVISEDPWILRFPNFLSDEEVAFLLDTEAFGEGWKDASDTGPLDEWGRAQQTFSSHRKTAVLWCNHRCHQNRLAKQVRGRIGEMLRIHPHYFEHFQFLRYSEGQYYREHHDAAGGAADERGLHRILTFFLYLNDVPAGGETEFPQLGLKVKPAKGSAILWPSVRNENPYMVDGRTSHAALPVKEGMKYSMNIWVHQGPFALAHYIACTGSPID